MGSEHGVRADLCRCLTTPDRGESHYVELSALASVGLEHRVGGGTESAIAVGACPRCSAGCWGISTPQGAARLPLSAGKSTARAVSWVETCWPRGVGSRPVGWGQTLGPLLSSGLEGSAPPSYCSVCCSLAAPRANRSGFL